MALLANEARFFRFRVFFWACSLLNEVGDPPFFDISDITNSSTLSGKSLRKKSMLETSLNRNYGFCDVIVPTYSIDEFKSHFRMTRGTLDILGREVAATGIIPQGNRFGRPPMPVQCQVMRSASDRFDVTLSSLFRIIQRVLPWAWNW